MDANEALNRLKEGNGRFVLGKPSQKDFTVMRAQFLSGQHPFVTVLSCSDSRIVPEYIFDAGLGEIFTVINAGNIASDFVSLGSIEYGVGHLHTPLLVVMSHENCGAIAATCACKGASEEGHIKDIVKAIGPIAKKHDYDADKCVMNCMRETVKDFPQKSEIVKKLVDDGKLKIVAAYYSMTTGKVRFFE